MVETYDDFKSSRWNQDFCCPKCNSNDIIIESNNQGYFWLFYCNNCGHKGHEDERLGCIRDDKIIV